jgi:hypothetical protein
MEKENEWTFEKRISKLKAILGAYEEAKGILKNTNYEYNKEELPSKEELQKLELLLKDCTYLHILPNFQKTVSLKGVVQDLIYILDPKTSDAELIYKVSINEQGKAETIFSV